jgi:hypothetical protein
MHGQNGKVTHENAKNRCAGIGGGQLGISEQLHRGGHLAKNLDLIYCLFIVVLSIYTLFSVRLYFYSSVYTVMAVRTIVEIFRMYNN